MFMARRAGGSANLICAEPRAAKAERMIAKFFMTAIVVCRLLSSCDVLSLWFDVAVDRLSSIVVADRRFVSEARDNP